MPSPACSARSCHSTFRQHRRRRRRHRHRHRHGPPLRPAHCARHRRRRHVHPHRRLLRFRRRRSPSPHPLHRLQPGRPIPISTAGGMGTARTRLTRLRGATSPASCRCTPASPPVSPRPSARASSCPPTRIRCDAIAKHASTSICVMRRTPFTSTRSHATGRPPPLRRRRRRCLLALRRSTSASSAATPSRPCAAAACWCTNRTRSRGDGRGRRRGADSQLRSSMLRRPSCFRRARLASCSLPRWWRRKVSSTARTQTTATR
mmetsp:Transcript_40824/g.123593  ORF Transcript_40824/g.123593 Transcript_40824/m.123593 type:complete len:262 (-) Transcript_40824:462-1247(-)